MNINKKLQNFTLIGLTILGIIALVIGSFKDLDISTIGNINSGVASAFTAIGPIVCLTIGNFCCAFMYFIEKKWSKFLNILLNLIGVIGFLGFTGFEIYTTLSFAENGPLANNEMTYKVLLVTLVFLIDLCIIVFARRLMKKVDTERLIVTSLCIIFIILFSSVSCECIKLLSNRPRPHEVHAGISEFVNWYVFQPKRIFDGAEHSFMSGHTVNSAATITIIPLFASMFLSEKSVKIQIISTVVGILFAFVVSFSRILGDMHFLSDVGAGIAWSCLWQIFVINVLPLIVKFKKG